MDAKIAIILSRGSIQENVNVSDDIGIRSRGLEKDTKWEEAWL